MPITLQGFFVYLTGLILTHFWAGMSMLLYLLMGILGLPVFAQGASGLSVVTGPTGGYLIGFVLGAMLLSRITRSARQGAATRPRWVTARAVIPGLLACSALMLTLGAACGKWVTQLDWPTILSAWVWPLLPGSVIKMSLALLVGTELLRKRSAWIAD